MNNSRTKTEIFARRILDALRDAEAPIHTRDLARIARCDMKQVYMVIGWAKRYLEDRENTSLKNTPGIGYRIAGIGIDDPASDDGGGLVPIVERRQQDLVDEQTKIASRMVAHAKRHKQIGDIIDPSKITDPDYMQAVGINRALGGFTTGLVALQSEIKSLMSRRGRELVAKQEHDARAPNEKFNVENYSRHSDDNS